MSEVGSNEYALGSIANSGYWHGLVVLVSQKKSKDKSKIQLHKNKQTTSLHVGW